MAGCGVLTKGSDPNDDLVPCGTRLFFGSTKTSRSESVLLCSQCKEKSPDDGNEG